MPRPKRRFGQHFLSDPSILRRIAEAVQAEAGDTVLEIGPGPGGLTEHLLESAGRVIAIEKDRDLIPGLRSRFPRLELIEADALEVDWHEIVGPGPFRVVGNIPYNITSPLLDRALTPPRPVCVVFLVQQEVADRVAARHGTAEYGALSVGVQAAAKVERLFKVPAGAFRPRPKVDSAVLRLTPRPDPLVSEQEAAAFRRFVVGAFGFRRKQLLRGMRELLGCNPAEAAALLARAGIAPQARPADLSPAEFATLFLAAQDSTG